MMSSHKKNTLEANLERYRISSFQSIAKKLVMLEAGYEGNFNFMDGSPSMFWIHQESPGLSHLQNYLRVCYGDKVGDGGGEGLGIGSPVLAKYSEDNLYYRARVQEVVLQDPSPAEAMYSVVYVDYGNSEVVSGLELMTWDKMLDLCPEQAVACCLEEAPSTWREEGRATWTPEQLEAFQRTMRRGQLKVKLRRELRQDNDPRKARFEALVWLQEENLLQILQRQSVFADDLASWEPGYSLESEMDKLAIGKLEIPPRPLSGKSMGESSFVENTRVTPRLPHSTAPVLLTNNESELSKLEPGSLGNLRGISGGKGLRGIGASLMSPGAGGAAIVEPESLGGSRVPHSSAGSGAIMEPESLGGSRVPHSSASVPIAIPGPISTVPEQATDLDSDTEAPSSPVPLPILKKSKALVKSWLIGGKLSDSPWGLNEQSSCEAIPTARVDERKVVNAPGECNSDIVNFAEPPIGEE